MATDASASPDQSWAVAELICRCRPDVLCSGCQPDVPDEWCAALTDTPTLFTVGWDSRVARQELAALRPELVLAGMRRCLHNLDGLGAHNDGSSSALVRARRRWFTGGIL